MKASLSQIVRWSREAISRTDTRPYLLPTVLLQAVEEVTRVGQPEGQHLQILQMLLRQEKTMKARRHRPLITALGRLRLVDLQE